MKSELSKFFRDITQLNGEYSGGKIGMRAAQIIAAYLLLTHFDAFMARWDAMTLVFLVMIAPEFYNKFLTARLEGVVK